MRVLQTDPMLHPIGDRLLAGRVDLVTASSHDASALIHEGAGAVAIVARSPAHVGAEVLDALPLVRVLVATGAGADCFDVEAATSRGIPVVHTPGVAPEPVAEYVVGMAVVLLRRLHQHHRRMRDGGWRPDGPTPAGVAGQTIGLVGFGHIAREVARRALHGLAMEVVAYAPSTADAELAAAGVERRPTLLDLLATSDVVSLHVPLRPSTIGLIGRRQLKSMRPGSVLVNTSRGAVIDEAALVEALASGHLAGAALDVFAEEPSRSSTPSGTCRALCSRPTWPGSRPPPPSAWPPPPLGSSSGRSTVRPRTTS